MMLPVIILLMVLILLAFTPFIVLLYDLWVYTLFNYHPAPFNGDQFGVAVIFVFIGIAFLLPLAYQLEHYRVNKIFSRKGDDDVSKDKQILF